jgi:K(+)-stimulated pyrophosphate-energized sodium pump
MSTTSKVVILLALLLLPLFCWGSEASLLLPDLGSVQFVGVSGHTMLAWGMLLCLLGLLFGFIQYTTIRKLPVHKSMKEVSDLIFETCKTYLITQGKFLIILEILVGIIIVMYFGVLQHLPATTVTIIILCSIIGIMGSYGVAWYGMRVNTFANSRSAFSSLRGRPYPTYHIPLKAGMSVGMMLISVELLVMLAILLYIPREFAGACFIGFAIGESLGASVLRIAGGIFTKIADIGSDLMKIVFKIKEDDARNPGVIADCTGDNAGDSVGPTADGFETYGVTGVALITFILLAIKDPTMQVSLLVWIFVMRLVMLVSSGFSYYLNDLICKIKFEKKDSFNFEHPLTSLVWITSITSIILTFIVSNVIIGNLGDGTIWWKLSLIITCGTLAGAIIPEIVKIFTSTKSYFVKNVLTSSQHGGPSLNILSGLVAGNYSSYVLGLIIVFLMGLAFLVSTMGLSALMIAPAVFAFGLVAFGFLSMGPVTIAVDSYGPVTDNAQSVYELSQIEDIPNISKEIEKDFGFKPNFEKAKHFLEENDGCGNTFKATAKPVLIGTAVVGATTMIFSIIMLLTNGLTIHIDHLSVLWPPFLLGLITGGAMIYWFTGATIHAVTSGAYEAVEFIKDNIKLDGATKASTEDSKQVVKICTQYAQKGMVNIFMAIFFGTLAFACLEPFFFIGYLISIAIFGLYQAIFMANAGGAWDNTKKIVEVDMKERGTALHDAAVIGDTVGDPFKDTSAVSMNPVIKFTTLFGLLAMELALGLSRQMNTVLFVIFFIVSFTFVFRSFFSMRIDKKQS